MGCGQGLANWQVPTSPWTGGAQRCEPGCPGHTAGQDGDSGLASWGPLGATTVISPFEDFPFCLWGALEEHC